MSAHRSPDPTPDEHGRQAVGPRILLVEDDRSFRETLRQMLHDRGFATVSEAEDGRRGVELAGELRPDVILMDVRMPGLSGIEAARLIRRDHPRIRIIMLSAYDDEGLRTAALAAGAGEYLVKGCRPRLIIESIARAWERDATP